MNVHSVASDAGADPCTADHKLSHAVSALILMRAEGRAGEWVSVDELASHLGCTAETVRRHCDALVDEGKLQQDSRLHLGQLHHVRCPAR